MTILVFFNLPKFFNSSRNFTENDVALVTGASRGLGHNVVQELLGRGVKHVYVLDINEPTTRLTGVEYVRCDVANEHELKSKLTELVRSLAERNLQVTICVNNAGVRHSESLLNLSDDSIRRIFNVNTFSHLWTIKTLLLSHLAKTPVPVQHKRLFITSVSSVLGELGPKNLSAYAGSKAALTQIYESLRQELRGYRLILLLLVIPGQLNTPMFQDVVPSKQILAPIVRSDKLAKKIVDRIQQNHGGVLCAPLYANVLPAIRVLPMWLQAAFRWFTDMDNKVIDQTEKNK